MADRASFSSNPLQRSFFLELVLREVNAEGHRGVSLTPTSWTKVQNEFNEKFNTTYDHKCFKNQYDYMRKDYSLWRKLVSLSGHGFSADINTINWPSEKWQDVLEKYPEAKKFRNKPLQDVELMVGIFEGTLAKGERAWSHLSSMPRPMTQRVIHEEPTNEVTNLDEDHNDSYFQGLTVEEGWGNSDIGTTHPMETTSKRSTKKRRKNSPLDETDATQLERLIKIIEEQVNEEKKMKGPCFEEVDEIMNDLKILNVLSEDTCNAAILKFAETPFLMQAFLSKKNESERVRFLDFITKK